MKRYLISEASAITGLEAHVLRYWEEELGMKIPRNELFYPQLGVKTLLDGGRRRTKNLYGVVKRTVPAGQVRQ